MRLSPFWVGMAVLFMEPMQCSAFLSYPWRRDLPLCGSKRSCVSPFEASLDGPSQVFLVNKERPLREEELSNDNLLLVLREKSTDEETNTLAYKCLGMLHAYMRTYNICMHIHKCRCTNAITMQLLQGTATIRKPKRGTARMYFCAGGGCTLSHRTSLERAEFASAL
jgi:hypothetical protein